MQINSCQAKLNNVWGLYVAKISIPKILRWARRTAGYGIDDVAKRVRCPPKQVAKWEQGNAYPTYNQLEKIADYYHRPLVLFFFHEVPEEKEVKFSFRSLPTRVLEELPPKIRLVLRKGRIFQLSLHELTNGINPAQQLITDALEVRDILNTKDLVKKTRKLLEIDIDQQKSWGENQIAFQNWRDAITKKGVYVFKKPFREDGYSGFCLYDKEFPVIFINNSLVFTRQIFTLFHELAHLVFGNNHIDNTDNDREITYLKYVDKKHQPTERFCNEFAAEFLLPTLDFAKEVDRSGTTSEAVDKLAKLYCVSRAVVLRKMLTDKYIDNTTYCRYLLLCPIDLIQIFTKSDFAIQPPTNLFRCLISNTPMNKYDRQEITFTEAADYLDIEPRHYLRSWKVFFMKPDIYVFDTEA